MENRLPLDAGQRADHADQDEIRDDGTHEVAPDLAYKRLVLVNVIFYGLPGAGDRRWVLIDAGVMGSAGQIADAAAERFGPDARPSAIVLTHGHFDHVGALESLAKRWDAPIFAHAREMPYLNGHASYPPPDPSVGGGLMSLLSPLYPRGPIDVSQWLELLPQDGSVPGMPGWLWLHTPGHTPGHVSLWRKSDNTLISGDAVITTRQESAYAVAMQQPELHGPPAYFTANWDDASTSVQRLAALEPVCIIPGHGRAMRGPELGAALHALAHNFAQVAIPEHGRYRDNPADAGDGSAYVT